jgi:hypothetical protein
MWEGRPPPGAVKSTPIAIACAVALAYLTYSVHYRGSTAYSAANSGKSVPWWKPSN